MTPDPLKRVVTPARVGALVKAGVLSEAQGQAALTRAFGPHPAEVWRRHVTVALAGVGALLALAGVIFFFAYNWADLGRLAKLSLAGGLVGVLAISARAVGLDRLAGRATLGAACVAVGAWLALYGQIYQTGADPWQLFAGWAGLIIPWALVSRLPPVGLLWLLLVDTAVILFQAQVPIGGEFEALVLGVALTSVNAACWIAAEVQARGLRRWWLRVVALMTWTPLTLLMILVVFEPDDLRVLSLVPLVMWLGGLWVAWRVFRWRSPDLFMLAAGGLSALVVVGAVMTRLIFEGGGSPDELGLFLMGGVIIGLVTLLVWWLRGVQRSLSVAS